jgi:2,4-dienoyl-CoA reductase-like NADH-dependent reductase (Old Yellow Enzyme family)
MTDAVNEGADDAAVLVTPLELPCGLVLPNRIVKAAMSDSLGNGRGHPTSQQLRLYERWLGGGAALAIIGEVQVDPRFAEKPGNLVLGWPGAQDRLRDLARIADAHRGHLWPQLGHAGALAHEPIAHPAGPSALDIDGLSCAELSVADIERLPEQYALAAQRALDAGFTGVEVHTGHGFLLSQFLSPLFNHRTDRYGGSIEDRARLLLEIVQRIRAATGPAFAIGVKLNATDQLEGGLTDGDALTVVELLDRASIDLIDISGGTYFPGAASSSDRASLGPYFVDFARRARTATTVPLMLTGGVKTRREAAELIRSGDVDLVGLARSMILDPALPAHWSGPESTDPEFPAFATPPPGGVTAWYTMRLAAMAEDREASFHATSAEAIDAYESRDAARVASWNREFSDPRPASR